MKLILKIFIYSLIFLFLAVLGLAIFLKVKSSGKAEAITDNQGVKLPKSISTIEKIKLGGVNQHLIIRGADSTKAVILYLHGGPGSPEFTFMKNFNQEIENDYVMVYWEQRGAGKSYSNSLDPETMNLEQFVSDTKELSQILKKRFEKDKIYLMGHSWGSFLGILTAYRYPELYHAYLGIGQVCHQYKSEKEGLEWAKEQAKRQKNEDAIEKLASLHFPDSTAKAKKWMSYIMTQRNYVTQFGGGVTHKTKSMLPIITMILNTKEYSFGDKMKFMQGSFYSTEKLWPSVVQTNLFNEIDSMQVPTYIFQGVHDYQTTYGIAKEFYEKIKAPQKAFYSFENSAHSPVFEEPEKFNSLLKQIYLNTSAQ